MITRENLLKEIESCFPFVDMPPRDKILYHEEECIECTYLLKDIEEYREKNVDSNLIRLLHQELSLLSPQAWRWILPYYLRYCLTTEAILNQMEIEFLIYNLNPDKDFELDTSIRLSTLEESQFICLTHFLQWLLTQQYWSDFFYDEIYKGIYFLKNMQKIGH